MRPSDAFPHPSEWKKTTVGDAVEVKRGVTWSKDQESPAPRDGAVPVIRISNVQDSLDLHDLLFISGLKPKVIKNKRVSADWSIIVGSNGNRRRIGNAVYIADDTNMLFASFLIAAKPKADSEVAPKYFYRWLRSEQVQAYLSASSEGSTGLNNLSHSFFNSMTIPYPDKNEQKSIVYILDILDSVIEKAQIAQGRAENLKYGLGQTFFTEGTGNQCKKKTRIGHIPVSWEVKPISDVVVDFEYGLSLAMSQKGTTPILRMGNIQNGDVVMEGLKYVTLPARTLDRYSLKRGDVLFNRTNSQEHVGKIGIYRTDEEAVFASYLIRLHTDKNQIDNYFLGQLLNSYSAQCRIKRYATPGVQQVNINAKNLGKVLVPVPCGPNGLDEQREIADILEKADEKIRRHAAVVKALEQLRKSLMQDLLTGKVRIDPKLFNEEEQA